MPRIRKKTSRRGTTHNRRRIQEKVRETRKKRSKAAKKDTQWKSKQKKDPGIPSQFPYKDQVLAEVEEGRRQAAEAKAQRKSEKNALKHNPQNGDEVEGIGAIHAKTLINAKTTSRPVPVADDEDEEDEDVPMLVNPDLPNLNSVLDEADVVVQILDVRDPMSFRSSHLEQLVKEKGKKTFVVLSKSDVVPKEAATSWLSTLRQDFPETYLFRAASSFLPADEPSISAKGKGKEPVDDALGAAPVLERLTSWADEKKGDDALNIAVVGLTNVGKSSFVNSLLQSSAFEVYTLASSSRGPTTTSRPQESNKGKLRFIDTPGLLWASPPSEDGANDRAKDILLRNKGRIDKLKDPEPCVQWIVERATAEDLMLLHKLPAFQHGSTQAFLSGVARAERLIKKRGELDFAGASKVVLRSWSTGKTRWYTTPSGSPTSEATTLTPTDEVVLDSLKPRKEMRKQGGLVKLQPGQIDERQVDLEEPYGDDGSDDESEDGPEGLDDLMEGLEDGDEDVSDKDVEEEEEEEEEEPEPEFLPAPPSKGKRKRRNATEEIPSAPAPKKVAFETKKTKPKAEKSKLAAGVPKSAMKAKKKVDVKDSEEAYDFGKFF